MRRFFEAAGLIKVTKLSKIYFQGKYVMSSGVKFLP